MSEERWDSSELAEPRRGLPVWGKVLIGCLGGCLLVTLVLVGSCVGFASWVSKDPEGFERRVEGFVKDFAAKEWARFREDLEALRTEAGARALYARSPRLQEAHGSEAEFLKLAASWRPLLEPAPKEIALKSDDFTYSQHGRGSYDIGYRNSLGSRIQMTYERGELVRLRVRAGDPATPSVPETPEPPAPPEE